MVVENLNFDIAICWWTSSTALNPVTCISLNCSATTVKGSLAIICSPQIKLTHWTSLVHKGCREKNCDLFRCTETFYKVGHFSLDVSCTIMHGSWLNIERFPVSVKWLNNLRATLNQEPLDPQNIWDADDLLRDSFNTYFLYFFGYNPIHLQNTAHVAPWLQHPAKTLNFWLKLMHCCTLHMFGRRQEKSGCGPLSRTDTMQGVLSRSWERYFCPLRHHKGLISHILSEKRCKHEKDGLLSLLGSSLTG